VTLSLRDVTLTLRDVTLTLIDMTLRSVDVNVRLMNVTLSLIDVMLRLIDVSPQVNVHARAVLESEDPHHRQRPGRLLLEGLPVEAVRPELVIDRGGEDDPAERDGE
jgi:hypothetical protein